MDVCKNCGTVITDRYCPHCGQEKITGRLEAKHIFKDALHGIFHWESSFFSTFKEMLLRPGLAVRNYINGRRKIYVKPFTYFIFIWTVAVFVHHWTDVLRSSNTYPESDTEFWDIISSYIIYVFFFFPVVFAWVLELLTKKKTGINYAEGIVFSLYVFGTYMVFEIARLLLNLVSIWLSIAVGMTEFVYVIYAIKQFSGYTWLKGVFKGTLIITAGYLLLSMILIIFSVIVYFVLYGRLIPL